MFERKKKDMPDRILIIDDEPQITRVLRAAMSAQGYDVRTANDPEEGLQVFKDWPPDLVITDLMMPGMSGVDVTRAIRTRTATPVLVLSVRDHERTKVEALDAGADDYVTKPFSPRELAARVKALLRRADPGTPSEKPIEVGLLRIDPAAYRVTRATKPVPMSTLEFRLLYFLAARPNRVFTRDQLLDAVWGTERFVTPRSVDVYVRRLREKIETDPQHPAFMKTIRGAGYLFETRAS
jgi:two-component system KDP operon response regulator KdpE